MDAFLLSFRNPLLERAYDQFLLSEGQWTNDKSVYGFVTLGNLLSVARLWDNKEGDLLLLLPQLLGWLVISMAMLYRSRVLKQTGVPAWRTEAVIVSRIWIVLCICYVENRILKKNGTEVVEGISIAQGAWGNHAFQLLILAWCLHLKLKIHLVVQAFMVILMLVLDGGAVCGSNVDSGVHETYANITRSLDAASGHILTNLYSIPGGMVPPQASNIACFRIMWFTHIFWGFGLVSYSVWLMEMRSRAVFIKMLKKDTAWLHIEKPDIQWSTSSTLLYHIPVGLIAIAVSWELSSFLPGLWQALLYYVHMLSGGLA